MRCRWGTPGRAPYQGTHDQTTYRCADVLPGGAFDIGKDQVDRVLAKEDLKLGLAFVFFFYSRCGAPMAA
jgi:hypothetical protein